MKLVIFFIFLFLMPFTLAYSPGEKLLLNYTNITDAEYPCEFRNGSVYLVGNINVGDQECEITYYDSYTQEKVTTPVESGSGGGSGGNSVKCVPWGECINNKTIRLCNIGVRNYNQTKSCVSNLTKKIEIKPIEIIEEPKIEQKVIISNETQAPITTNIPPKNNNSTLWIVIILVSILILGGGILSWWYINN